VLTIVIQQSSLIPATLNASKCINEDITIFGEIYSTGGTYFDTIQSVTGGCDTAYTIIIADNPLLTDLITYSGCEGDGYSIIIDGTVYDESNPTGTDTITGIGPACDTIVTIDLTFAPNIPAQITPAGPLCTDASTITLQATPAGGVWSGSVSSNHSILQRKVLVHTR
jgi:hypothetical protein